MLYQNISDYSYIHAGKELFLVILIYIWSVLSYQISIILRLIFHIKINSNIWKL